MPESYENETNGEHKHETETMVQNSRCIYDSTNTHQT